MDRDRNVWRLAGGIFAVWTASIVADAIPGLDYNPPSAVHAAMMGVVGWAFGRGVLARNRDEDRSDERR